MKNKPNIIIETDIGHDPDDLFAILYLAAIGVNIRMILINPGDLDQIAITKFLCSQLGLEIPIFAHKDSTKMSSGSVHHELLRKYKHPLQSNADTTGQLQAISETLKEYPDCGVLVIGPPKTIGFYLATNNDPLPIPCLTMQGGFVPYHLHSVSVQRLDRFEGKETFPTYNMNGAVHETQEIVATARIAEKRFVGKNVCHTIKFDRKTLDFFNNPHNRAAELFIETAKLYFNKHEEKKFHDPLAAFLFMRPEHGVWLMGKPFRSKGGWGTDLMTPDNSRVLVDVDREAFWEHIGMWIL